MIFIQKTLKGSNTEKPNSFSLEEAVKLCSTVKTAELKRMDILILGSDPEGELKEFLQFFNDSYVVKAEGEHMFDVYKLNPNTPFSKRLLVSGARRKAIEKFAVKISTALRASSHRVYYGGNYFSMAFEKDGYEYNYICSYDLEIRSSYVANEKKAVNIDFQDTKKNYIIVNSTLTKQRYYYKKGKAR